MNYPNPDDMKLPFVKGIIPKNNATKKNGPAEVLSNGQASPTAAG
jgi:hypothetical protein